MTFRRKLTCMVIAIILLSIVLTGAITSAIINNYFEGYLSEEYEETVGILKEDSKKLLLGTADEEKFNQYLKDPITSISIYTSSGDLSYYKSNSQSERGRMKMPMFSEDETDRYDIKADGETIGTLVIERSSEIQDSKTVFLFDMALFRGVCIAAVVALIFSFLLSKKLSKGITKELKDTATFANEIEGGNEVPPKNSKIVEIQSIQKRLVNLSRKLKVRDGIRKEKVDHIAHESRTPITVLKGQLEGALDNVLVMDEKRLKTCLEAVSKLEILTTDIGTVLELGEEKLLVEKETFDLMEEIKMIQTGLVLQYEKKGLTLEIEGPDTLEIKSDKNLLSVSLYNLIINALKFTEKGGVKISVTTFPTNIIIEDTGIGISNSHLEQIFEPYYRAVSKEMFPGDGLGLYITKKNLEAMGGKVTVTSQEGKGTKFVVVL